MSWSMILKREKHNMVIFGRFQLLVGIYQNVILLLHAHY